jgi:hypothetical protein
LSYGVMRFRRWRGGASLAYDECTESSNFIAMSSAFLHRFLDPETRMPRHKAFWVVLGALVAGQMVALALLCSQQVRHAEIRQAAVREHKVAVADCLRHAPGASLVACGGRPARDARLPEPDNLPVASADAKLITLASFTR